jgi:hypothetical protein
MRRDILCIGALVLILAALVGVGLLPFMITGYDGIESTISRVDHGYIYYEEDVGLTGYGIDPYLPVIDGLAMPMQTGLRVEIGQPRQVETRTDWSDSISVLDKEAETNTTTIWEAHIVYMEMGATISTYGSGTLTIQNVEFWIRLIENPYSFFTGADESEAYILAVSMIDKAVISGDIDVEPTAKGYGFPLTTLSDDPTPQWLLDSGYTGNLGRGKEVEFKLKCLDATPSHIAGMFRTEASATFRIQVEVLLFGEWEVVQEYIEWDWPIPEDFIVQLISFLTLMAWVIVGFVATILIFRFVPDVKLKLLATGIVWVVLLAIYGINAITVWLMGAG